MQQSKTIAMSKDKPAGPRAIELHRNGFHCAEAVLIAVLESMNHPIHPTIPRSGTCFGGGVGRTHEELCGALAGGLMAVGCLLGRDQQGKSWDCAAQAAAALRERFLERQGSTCCGDILATLGPQQNQTLCHQLSAATAELTCEILETHAGS